MAGYIKGNAYNPDLYHDDRHTWQEGDYTVVRTTAYTAPGCHNGCGVLYYLKDGRVAKVEGDPNNGFNQGTLCMRCLDMREALELESRIKYPMRRSQSDRGLDKWERISWDEAYDLIAEKVDEYTEAYGRHSISVHVGTGRNITWQGLWLGYVAFQSPNYGSGFLSGDSCYTPRAGIMAVTAGDFMISDMSQTHPDRYDSEDWQLPGTILVWGCNPVVSSADGFLGHWVVEAMKRGAPAIVVDPRCTWIAAHAEYWLPVRPGTDAALAMAILNVLTGEDLIDHDFVENWCQGYDALAAAMREWTPERASEICDVDAELIRKAARFIGTHAPVALQWGVSVDMQASTAPLSAALIDIAALTGSVDAPGGFILMPGHAYNVGLEPWSVPEVAEGLIKRYGSLENFMSLRIGQQRFFKGEGPWACCSPDILLQAIESGSEKTDTEERFPIKMSVFMATNPLANMSAEAPRVYEAMKNIEFCVFIDYVMTPSIMAAADLVLPCAMTPERDSVRAWWFPLRSITKVTQYHEAKSDEQIVFDLIKRLNPEFPIGESVEDWLDRAVNSGGLDYGWKGLRDRVIDWPEWNYRKYEKGLLRADGQPGFRTMTGRFLLENPILLGMGLPASVPFYEEPHESPLSTPDLAKEYPFVLTSGRRSYEFFHSEHRNIPTLRSMHPDPIVEIHPDTARELGLGEGDWAWIENMRGRCRQRVRLYEGMSPKVVMAEHGWWFPEADPERLFNTFDSNINNLTSQCDVGPSGRGAAYKSTICKVYKCTDENSEVMPTEQVLDKGGFEYERKHII